MTYAEDVDARRRLAILKLMREDGGQANDGALATALRSIGEGMGLDQNTVRRLLRDLADRDCVAIEMVRDTVMLARLTERGRMAVVGDASVAGVQSPFSGL